MKRLTKLPTWPLKVILVVWFITNTGCHKLFTKMDLETKHPSWTPVEQERRMRVVSNLLKEKSDAALAKDKSGGVYSIYDYFRDYGDLKLLSDSLQIPTILSGYMFETLHQLGQKYLIDGHGDELGKAQALYYARTKDPISRPHDQEDDLTLAEVLLTLTHWLSVQYIKGIVPAFILLLLWFRKRRKKASFANCVSFLLSLLFHPISVGWIIVSKFRETVTTAEVLSRKEKLFSVVSEREIQSLRRIFAQSTFWRNSNSSLIEAHLGRRHNIAFAFIVAVLLQFIPQGFVKAQKAPTEKTDMKEVIFQKMTSHIVNAASLQLVSQTDQAQEVAENATEPWIPDPLTLKVKIIPWYFVRMLPDVFDRIDHIPLVVVNALNVISFTTKKYMNEKTNNYFIACTLVRLVPVCATTNS